MDVYAIGSEVLLDGDVVARVVGIIVRENCVRYEIVWWNDRSREQEEVEAWEVRPNDDKTRTQRVNPVL